MTSLDLGPSFFGFQKLVYRARSCKQEVSSLLLYHTIVYTVIRRVFTFLRPVCFHMVLSLCEQVVEKVTVSNHSQYYWLEWTKMTTTFITIEHICELAKRRIIALRKWTVGKIVFNFCLLDFGITVCIYRLN